MDNAQKAIMIGVGLFITIIVIAAVMLITGIGQDMLNTGTNQLSGISEELNSSTFATYQDKTYNTGSLAFTAAKNLMSMGGEVYIKNKASGTASRVTSPMTTTTAWTATTTSTAFFTTKKYTCDVSNTKVTFNVVP